MTWTDLTSNWDAALRQLAQRFPHMDTDAVADAPAGPDALAAHVAQTHDLTRLEAREELHDWMFVAGLARQAGADMRLG